MSKQPKWKQRIQDTIANERAALLHRIAMARFRAIKGLASIPALVTK